MGFCFGRSVPECPELLMRRSGVWLVLLSGLLLVFSKSVRSDEPVRPTQPEFKLSMNAGGIGRHVSNRWGMTKATVINQSKESRTALVVVTPPSTGGLQYAKSITVPARANFESSWPVLLGKTESTVSDFGYLIFPDGVDDGIIHRRMNDEFVPTYAGLVAPSSVLGLTGFMYDSDEPTEQVDATLNLLRLMSYSRRHELNVVSVGLADLSWHSECLEPLDQLTVTSSQLIHYPHAVESIRLWLQRGGRLWIRLDRTGIDSARALLDDALPLSVIGETSTDAVVLTLNPDYRQKSYPVREVSRVFEEPIRYVRVVQEGGEVFWNIDGWPVSMQIPVGRGNVVVTTVDPSVFFEPRTRTRVDDPQFQLIPSCDPIQTALFSNRLDPILRQDPVAEQAASVIGYRIPSRFVAIGLTMCFPMLLLFVGLHLQRREKGERLILLLPLIAILAAIPAVGLGSLGRGVAPKTVIETALVQSVPGSRRLVSDGYASIFDFGSEALNLSGTEGTVVEVPFDSTNRNYRRLVWTGTDTCQWEGLKQHGGIQTFAVRSLESLPRPLSVTATFDKNGVRGRLDSGGLTDVGDLIIAGMGPERMSLHLDSGDQFRATPQDVLAIGDFSGRTLVSDQQRRRAEIYASVLDTEERNLVFPAVPSLLFWAQSNRRMLDIGDTESRRERSLLVIHPLRMESPEPGAPITIPSPFISLRTIADANGRGFSAIFDNRKRQWSRTEASSLSFMQFQIPSVCLPFEADGAVIEMLIRAGSRTVKVSVGSFESQTLVSTLVSPLGLHSIAVPVELIRESSRDGKFYVSLDVSDLDEAKQDNSATDTQNDYWEISRLGLTLKGKRMPEIP